MQKQIILIMEQEYPFGGAEYHAQKQSTLAARILVRKVQETSSLHQRNIILQKINLLRSMEMRELIRIQTVLEEQENIHMLYEYVPIKFNDYAHQLNENALKSIKEDILNLGIELAEKGLLVNWHHSNIGFSHQNQPKYYLGIQNIQLDNKYTNKDRRLLHLQHINQMFQPLLLRKYKTFKIPTNAAKMEEPTHPQIESENLTTSKKNRRERNWQQLDRNDEITKDFMNVLEDQEPEEQEIWKNQQQQVVWIDSQEIKRRASQAISRSKEVMKRFKELTHQYK